MKILQAKNITASIELRHKKFGFIHKDYGYFEYIGWIDDAWEIIKLKKYENRKS